MFSGREATYTHTVTVPRAFDALHVPLARLSQSRNKMAVCNKRLYSLSSYFTSNEKSTTHVDNCKLQKLLDRLIDPFYQPKAKITDGAKSCNNLYPDLYNCLTHCDVGLPCVDCTGLTKPGEGH